jgi:spore maturation protein CgeB
MTRVLLIAPDSDFTAQLHRAFRDEGHAVQYLNQRDLAAWPLVWRIIRRVPWLRRARNAFLARRIIRSARNFHPDMVLICKGMTIKEPTLHTLRATGAKICNWFPENGLHEPYKSWLDRSIGLYDVFFAFDSGLLERQHEFPRTHIVHLPLAVGPESFSVHELTLENHWRYDADICFVGAWYPERERVLAELTQWKMKIFGWKGWERSSLAHLYHGPLDATESAKAYRCAKIVVNMNLEPPVNGVNAKTFEICAARGFQLTDVRQDLPGLFTEDTELVVFRTVNELKEKIARYLADDVARRRIAEAGHERVMHEHTMRHRVRKIIASL